MLLAISTFGTFILTIVLTVTMVANTVALVNPIHPVASTGEQNEDEDNAKEERKAEKDERKEGNANTEEDQEETNQDTAEEVEEEEGDSDVNQELLNELRDGEDLKGSGSVQEEQSEGDLLSELRGGETTKQAPISISGENVYTAWWTNNTANRNDEVMFRASIDGGTTFGNKTNLSNTTSSDSVDAEIAAEGGNVIVTWWERNSTSNEPVARISTDNGVTFGPVLKLATNGTIGSSSSGNDDNNSLASSETVAAI
jgi:hypothetical protein